MIGMTCGRDRSTNDQFNPFRDKQGPARRQLRVDKDAIIGKHPDRFEEYAYGASTLGLGSRDLEQASRTTRTRHGRCSQSAATRTGSTTTMEGPLGRWPDSRAVMEAAAGFLGRRSDPAVVSEAQYQEVVTKIQAARCRCSASSTSAAPTGRDVPVQLPLEGNFSMGGSPDDRQDGTEGSRRRPRRPSTASSSRARSSSTQRTGAAARADHRDPVPQRQAHLHRTEPVTIVAADEGLELGRDYASEVLPEYWNIRSACPGRSPWSPTDGRFLARPTRRSRLVTVFLVVLVVFVVGASPATRSDSSPARTSRPSGVRRSRRAYGLDDPLLVQFGNFLGDVANGDFGNSFRTNQQAMEEVVVRAPASLQLAIAALLVARGRRRAARHHRRGEVRLPPGHRSNCSPSSVRPPSSGSVCC